ncbi:hypothetical protein [Lapillicoccus sp.]|uniref:hypothetical protein n=1 Tax=Lapillicoccus sp. TaxID=1909287 RepID=UPI0032635D6F
MNDDERRELGRSGPVARGDESATLPTPSGVVVGLRVLGACLGWGTLTGVVAAVAYLVLVMLTNSDVPLDGGSLFVLAVVYGSTVGLAAGVVFGLGAGVASAVATLPRASSATRSRGTRRVDASSPAQRAALAARAGVLVVALAVFAVWRLGSADSVRWLSSWELVLTVGVSVAFAVWRAGRSARRAVLGPRAAGSADPRTF